MKLYKMKCTQDPYLSSDSREGGGNLGEEKYAIYLETPDEKQAAEETTLAMWVSTKALDWWEGYMCGRLNADIVREDVCYYSYEPIALKGSVEDEDGYVWERIE